MTYAKAIKSNKIKLVKIKSKLNLEEYLEVVKNKRTHGCDRRHLKRLLVEDGLEYKCERCEISEWFGERLTLELDHIDGNPRNNVVNNFRLLCLNCHSLTSTWRGRNTRKAKKDID